MAQRFAGKYSPGAPQPGPQGGIEAAPKPKQRLLFLFLAPLAFAVPAFAGGPRALLLGLGACGILILAAWLTREGVAAHEAYAARRVARRPALPRKLIAAVLMAAGVGVGAMIDAPGPLLPILFGLAAGLLHLGAFGLDPLTDKGMEGMDPFQTERVANAVSTAEALLSAMQDAILRTHDAALAARVERFAASARALFRSVEADPGDLTAARKYLSVYLMGARDATVKFADVYAPARDPAVREGFEALLSDLETRFASRTKVLLASARTDLDVEIAVLRDRLKLET